MKWTDLLIDVPDFPKPGIVFKDITPVLANFDAFKQLLEQMIEPWINQGIDYVVGMESRGFILATPIAQALNAGFIPARKPQRLPRDVVAADYALEYGTNSIEIHKDAFAAGSKILIVDDVLATGGTAEATADLVNQLSGDMVGFSFMLELGFLDGRQKLNGTKTHSALIL